jgi:hypothetical protein
MANLIKIGSTFINLDQVTRVVDISPRTRANRLIVYFGSRAFTEHFLMLADLEADDLRTWLNSVATNLPTATDPDTAR